MEGVAGAILTGGASRRMGRTKALVAVHGVPMAQRVADALAAGGCVDIAVIGGAPAEFAELDITFVPDEYPGDGPLGGVITALTHFGTASHVLVAACDLPMLDARTVQRLLIATHEHPGHAATVAQTDRIEPALVVWNSACLADLVAIFDAGERAVHRALARLDTQAVVVAASALLNVNRPGEVPTSDGVGK